MRQDSDLRKCGFLFCAFVVKINDSLESEWLAVVGSQEPSSSRQSDKNLSSVPTTGGGSRSDSLKTLKAIKFDLKMKSKNPFPWSRIKEGSSNSVSGSGGDGGGFELTEEMLSIAPFAIIFATGSEGLLQNKHCFFCVLCKRSRRL